MEADRRVSLAEVRPTLAAQLARATGHAGAAGNEHPFLYAFGSRPDRHNFAGELMPERQRPDMSGDRMRGVEWMNQHGPRAILERVAAADPCGADA
jgi:hypothetical protein